MKNIFRGFYTPTQAEFETLWKNCTFILDTNVLLNLYRYPEQAKNDLLKALNAISARLWVPFYVTLEYQRNRIKVIAEQIKKFNEVDKVLKESESRLIDGLGALQLKKKHSSIDPEDMVSRITNILDEFREHLKELKEKQLNINDDDKIREAIDSLLKGKIGPEPKKQEDIDTIYRDAEKRYSKRIPPGFIDTRKEFDDDPIEFICNGIIYNRKYGDYLIWSQIINGIKENKKAHVIFITDDKKDDWWWTEDVLGKKTIGPRPELVEEICRLAGVKVFHMYNSDKFMEYSSKYLSVKYHKDSISQIRDVTSSLAYKSEMANLFLQTTRHAEEAVYNWLKSMYPGLIIKREGFASGLGFRTPDYIVETLLWGETAYETISIMDIRFLHDALTAKLAIIDYLKRKYQKYYLVVLIAGDVPTTTTWKILINILENSKVDGFYLARVQISKQKGELPTLEILNKFLNE